MTLFKTIFLISFIVLLDYAAVCSTAYFPLFDSSWNWQGKKASILCILGFIYLFRGVSPKEAGLGIPQDRTGWMWAAGIGLLMASSGHFVDLFLGGEFRGPPLETLAYQFTMPGLAEEPLYRGILLALFNRHFARKWSCFQVKMGWGAVFTALIFALVHVVTFSFKEQTFVLNMGAFIYPFLGGLVFAWIREKTGSIWPAVLAHNFANGFYHLGRWIVSGSSL